MLSEDISLHMYDTPADALENGTRLRVVDHEVPVLYMSFVLADEPGDRAPRSARALASQTLESAFLSHVLITERHEFALRTHFDTIELAFAACSRLQAAAALRLCERTLALRYAPP